MEQYRDQIICGDALAELRKLPDGFIQSCVTSPPYFGLRDYGTEPLIWGGDSSCQHEWDDWQEVHDEREEITHGKTRTTDRYYGDESRRFNGNHQKHTAGQFCLRCGAWRGSLGLEPTPQLYVSHLVQIFREVRRVLRKDGTLWVNIGDSYAGSWGNYAPGGIKGQQRQRTEEGERWERRAYQDTTFLPPGANPARFGLKNKDLMMIPARLALALQEDGWWLRSDIIWAKTNCMPESITDRPTMAHEHLFLLAKSERYYYDAPAIAEPVSDVSLKRIAQPNFAQQTGGEKDYRNGVNPNRSMRQTLENFAKNPSTRNKRNVWTLPSQSYSEAHFATMPPKLIEPCILAGSSPRACERCGAPWKRVIEPTGHINRYETAHVPNNTPTKTDSTGWAPTRRATDEWRPTCSCKNEGTEKCLVLDPFMGAGTVALVARQRQRSYLGIELNPAYITLIEDRITAVQPNLWDTPVEELSDQELEAWGHVLSVFIPDGEEETTA